MELSIKSSILLTIVIFQHLNTPIPRHLMLFSLKYYTEQAKAKF